MPWRYCAAVEADTKLIARAVLAEMARQGPVSDSATLTVFGGQPSRGEETGKEILKKFGHASYDSPNDKVEFVRDTGK